MGVQETNTLKMNTFAKAMISGFALLVGMSIVLPMLVDYKTCRAYAYGEAGGSPISTKDANGAVTIKGRKHKC